MNLERNIRIADYFFNLKSQGKLLTLPEGKIQINGTVESINGLNSVVESDTIQFKCPHEIELDNGGKAMNYDILAISLASFLIVRNQSLIFRQTCFNQEAQAKLDSKDLTDEEFEIFFAELVAVK